MIHVSIELQCFLLDILLHTALEELEKEVICCELISQSSEQIVYHRNQTTEEDGIGLNGLYTICHVSNIILVIK